MKRFFTEQVEGLLTEMRAKNPEGVKTVRSKTYSKTHDIHVDGEHVATISGTPANRFQGYRGAPSHLHVYRVYKNEDDMANGWAKGDHGHPAHQEEETRSHYAMKEDGKLDYDAPMVHRKVKVPKHYTSMEEAVTAIHTTHRNNKEFGQGHDKVARWKHAIDKAVGFRDHKEKADKYKAAIAHVSQLGHDEVTSQLQHHLDAHLANKPEVSHEKLKQWTHDAHGYTGTKWDNASRSEVPKHPEIHELAKQASNVYHSGRPDSSY